MEDEKKEIKPAMQDESNKNIDLSALDGLSPEERELALSILKEYANKGTSDTFDMLKYADYEEVPVDIETFLHDRNYLGGGLYDNEGRFTMYPY